jgi:hypothetical protein
MDAVIALPATWSILCSFGLGWEVGLAKMDLTRLSPWSIAASVGGVVLGIYAGFYLILPAVLAGIAWFALHNMAATTKKSVVPLIAWQFGQLGGFIIAGVLAPSVWAQTLPDVVILGALLLWFYLRRSRTSAWGLMIYQGLSVLVNAWVFLHAPIESDMAKALVVQIIWRVVAIVLLVMFIRRPAETDPATAAKTFE